MKLGYIGYGEAAYFMSAGLAEQGVEQYACSRNFSYKGKPEDVGVKRCASSEELFSICDTVFAMTPNTAAVPAAEKAAPYLREGIVYVDLSSAAPKLMEQAAALVKPTGALFVDAAMLDSLPKFRSRVRIVTSGEGAEELSRRLEGLDMRIDIVGEQPGAASAIKLLRSLYTKTHLGFALEMLEGAAHYGVADYVMQGLAETMDGKTFIEGMNERLSGGVLHATRRSFELAMAAEMLDDAGLDSSVSTAAAQKLRKLGELNLKEKLGDYRPTDWKDALRCIHEYRD